MSESAGHGGNWIVTYADMITLLMAGFIVIVTFASRETDPMVKKLDSVVGGHGGSGIAGPQRKGAEKRFVAVRPVPGMGNPFKQGSRTPPMYTDSPLDVAKNVREVLESDAPGKLSDSFETSFPIGYMFDGQTTLSQAGINQLRRIGSQMKKLPFDFVAMVGHDSEIPQATAVYKYLFETAGIHPGRLGIALRPESQERGKVWIMLRRKPEPNGRRRKRSLRRNDLRGRIRRGDDHSNGSPDARIRSFDTQPRAFDARPRSADPSVALPKLPSVGA